MMNKKTLDTEINDLWKRYMAGDVVEFARDNSRNFPQGFMERFIADFLASRALMNAHLPLPADITITTEVSLAQRMMYRLSNNNAFTIHEPAAYMSSFKKLVNKADPYAVERRASERAAAKIAAAEIAASKKAGKAASKAKKDTSKLTRVRKFTGLGENI